MSTVLVLFGAAAGAGVGVGAGGLLATFGGGALDTLVSTRGIDGGGGLASALADDATGIADALASVPLEGSGSRVMTPLDGSGARLVGASSSFGSGGAIDGRATRFAPSTPLSRRPSASRSAARISRASSKRSAGIFSSARRQMPSSSGLAAARIVVGGTGFG